jgi:hypothetical protein
MVWAPDAIISFIRIPKLKCISRTHLELCLGRPFLPSDRKLFSAPRDKDEDGSRTISDVSESSDESHSIHVQIELSALKQRVGITYLLFGEKLYEAEVCYTPVILDNRDVCVRFELAPAIVNDNCLSIAGESGWLDQTDYRFGRDRGPNFRGDLQSLRRRYENSHRTGSRALSKARISKTQKQREIRCAIHTDDFMTEAGLLRGIHALDAALFGEQRH